MLLSAAAHAAAADVATISGTVQTRGGAPVAGATITANGPAHVTTTADAAGTFTLTLSPGVYSILITKPGYETVLEPNVTAIPGETLPMNVTLAEATLTSLRTIGSVTVNGHGGVTMNTGAATQTYLDGQQFAQLANPQINDVLQRIPDVVIQKMGTQADQSIVVGGMQPYETQVLIDGHPLALGQYGVWLSQYFPSFLIGGVETQSGPGNTTPFANIAVGGTANIQTIGFTHKDTAEFTIGDDNWGSQFSNVLTTGSAGKLDYAIGLGTAGSNGYWFHKTECNAYLTDFSTAPNTAGFAGTIAYCGDLSGSLSTRGQMYKVRYEFSPATTLDFGFLGSYGGYSPQGSAWASSYGNMLVEQCVPGTYYCTNPADANLIGKTIPAFYWFPGTNIWNAQQMWTMQLRSTIGSTTLLVRPYLGSIQPETYDGLGEGGYPAFFGPPPGYAGPGLPYPGPQTIPPGQQIPPDFNQPGGPQGNAFEQSAWCGPQTSSSAWDINSPKNTEVSVNGQQECFQYPYSTYELDTLYGSTFSLVQPIQDGDGFLDLTYDFHGQSTNAYFNSEANVAVPLGSAVRYSTFSLTGSVSPLKRLAVNFGVYNTLWTAVGQQSIFDNMGNVIGTTGLQRAADRTDPHLAVVFRPSNDTSVRAAWGTSETFPFVGDLSGPPTFQPPAFLYTLGSLTYKTPGLLPEFSNAFDIGTDQRFGNGSVLSLDLQDTTVHNVFQQVATEVVSNAGTLGIFTPINIAKLDAKLATLKYSYAPGYGLGFNLAVTADSSIFSGVPAADYNSIPGLPANNVQVCGTGTFTPGLATCIPYLKGYSQINYTSRKGAFFGIGVDFEGKNNAYYQPPFAIADFVGRYPFSKDLDLNVSVENLFNSNSFNYLTAPGLGVAAPADYTLNGTTIQQGSYPPYRIPAPTRTLRFSLRAHIGR